MQIVCTGGVLLSVWVLVNVQKIAGMKSFKNATYVWGLFQSMFQTSAQLGGLGDKDLGNVQRVVGEEEGTQAQDIRYWTCYVSFPNLVKFK